MENDNETAQEYRLRIKARADARRRASTEAADKIKHDQIFAELKKIDEELTAIFGDYTQISKFDYSKLVK